MAYEQPHFSKTQIQECKLRFFNSGSIREAPSSCCHCLLLPKALTNSPTSAALPSEEHTACLISDQLDFKPSTVHGEYLIVLHSLIFWSLHYYLYIGVCWPGFTDSDSDPLSLIFSKVIITKVYYTMPSLAANMRYSLYPSKIVLCANTEEVFSYCPNILCEQC